MNDWQKLVKSLAIAFAVFLLVAIFGGILGGLRFLSALLDPSEERVGEEESFSLSQDLKSLKLEISAADLEIREGERFSLTTDLKTLMVKENKGTLSIREKGLLIGNTEEGNVILTVPRDTVLKKAELETGAGRVTLTGLSAESMNLELGAGEVKLSDVTVTRSTEIEGGAGKLVVEKSSLASLELSMGVGKVHLSAALHGSSELEMGVGEAVVTLLGKKEDYRVRIEKGLGDATLDSESVSDDKVFGSGNDSVEIHGGVGSLRVSFSEP